MDVPWTCNLIILAKKKNKKGAGEQRMEEGEEGGKRMKWMDGLGDR